MYFSDEKFPPNEMNKALFLLVPIALLIACKGKPKQPSKDDVTAAPPTQISLLKKLTPIYQGVWVKSDYIEKIAQTKSVLASVDLVIGITGLQIDSNLSKTDSLSVPIGWDNQNPGIIMLKNIPGKNPNTLQFGDYELGHAILNGDTNLILYQPYNGQLFKTRYNRVLPINPDRNLSEAINYAINKALIAGNYALKNATGKSVKITFTNDGVVTGLAAFKKYFIENDLKPAPLKNLDLITFDEFSNKKAVYTYLFRGNTLELYEAKPNAKATIMELGKLKYTLIRQ